MFNSRILIFSHEVTRYAMDILYQWLPVFSVYGGTEWTLSSAAGTIKFWKVSESDRIFSGFHILCLTCLIKCQWIWILPQKIPCQSSVTENAIFLYTAIVRNGSQLINKYGIWPRLMRPLILQNHLYEVGSFRGNFWYKGSVRAGNVNFKMLSEAW